MKAAELHDSFILVTKKITESDLMFAVSIQKLPFKT
jgi:hypothetical protein